MSNNDKKSFSVDSDGYFVAPDGCQYACIQQAYHYDLLGMCGCGDPTSSYNFLRSALKCFDQSDATRSVDRLAALVKKDPGLVAHVLAHILDDKGLLEHGSSVNSAWLTDSGNLIVNAPEVTDKMMDAQYPDECL